MRGYVKVSESVRVYDILLPGGIFLKQAFVPARANAVPGGGIYSIVATEDGFKVARWYGFMEQSKS